MARPKVGEILSYLFESGWKSVEFIEATDGDTIIIARCKDHVVSAKANLLLAAAMVKDKAMREDYDDDIAPEMAEERNANTCDCIFDEQEPSCQKCWEFKNCKAELELQAEEEGVAL